VISGCSRRRDQKETRHTHDSATQNLFPSRTHNPSSPAMPTAAVLGELSANSF
jgi:hypothetical protein